MSWLDAYAELAAKVVTQFHDGHDERYLLAYVYGHLGDHDLLKVRTDAEKSLLLAVLNLVECITLNYIEPGEPNQNAYIERFNRTYRHEVLDAYVFKTIEQVQHIIEDWLHVYNEQRPHDALGGLPPRQFLPRLTTAADSSNGLST